MSSIDQLSNNSQPEQVVSKRSSRNQIRGKRLWNWLSNIALVVMAVVMVAPFLWLVSSSLKSQIEIFQYPPKLIPSQLHFENYTKALTIKPFGLYLLNTMKIVILNVVAVVFSSSFAAYGFARVRFFGLDFWFGIVMATLFLPSNFGTTYEARYLPWKSSV